MLLVCGEKRRRWREEEEVEVEEEEVGEEWSKTKQTCGLWRQAAATR